jgi:hypothetical protein
MRVRSRPMAWKVRLIAVTPARQSKLIAMFLQVLSAAVSSLSGPCSAAGSRELREADVRRLGRGLRGLS